MRSTSEVRKARSRTPLPCISIGYSHGWGSRGSSRSNVAIQPSSSSPRCTSKRRTVPSKTKPTFAATRRDAQLPTTARHRMSLKPGDLESVVTDQLQRRSHDRAAARRRMQTKAHLSETVAFEVKDRCCRRSHAGVPAAPQWPSRVVDRWSNRLRSRARNSSASRKLVAIRRSRHRRPADHLRIAALLDHRREIAPAEPPGA